MAVIKLQQPQPPPRRRSRRLRSVATLPTLLTLGNMMCGFAAVHFALRAMFDTGAGTDAAEIVTLNSRLFERLMPTLLAVGAMCVFAGLVLDGFDGRLARLTRNTTNFGGQLDSLADMVTAGIAPAVLLVALMMRELHREAVLVTPFSDQAVGRAVFISAAVYVACAALRLARFNVEHSVPAADYTMFRGLPTPGAAAVVASLVFLQEHVVGRASQILIFALPFISVLLGLLMISRIPYVRVGRAYLRGRRPFGFAVVAIVVFGIFWTWKAPTVTILVCYYALTGPLEALGRLVRRRRHRASAPAVDQSGGPHDIQRQRA